MSLIYYGFLKMSTLNFVFPKFVVRRFRNV